MDTIATSGIDELSEEQIHAEIGPVADDEPERWLARPLAWMLMELRQLRGEPSGEIVLQHAQRILDTVEAWEAKGERQDATER